MLLPRIEINPSYISISEAVYKSLYPTGTGVPKFYGLPKVHKEGIPLRPIVSSIGAVSYETAKELANNIETPDGRYSIPSPEQQGLYTTNTGHKIERKPVHYVLWCEGTIHISASTACHRCHQEEVRRRWGTPEENQHVSTTHNQPPGVLSEKYWLHLSRQAVWTTGRSCHGISNQSNSANLFMEDFEKRAIESSPHPPCFCRRFVDDTFTIIYTAHKESFLEHLNSIDDHIQFTSEDPRPDGSMPFLDILITPEQDGSLSTTVYRKPTQTDLYLQWDSHHTVSAKYSVVGTLYHRAETICSSPLLLLQEEKHLQKALHRC